MTLTATVVTVADSATALVAADASGTATIWNRSADTSIFLGPAGVTTANGFELKFGETISIPITNADAVLNAIVAADTEPCHVLLTASE